MNIRKMTFISILSALAVVLSVSEGMLIPDVSFLPPGAKPGLANIVVMYAASCVGYIPALAITLIKSCFAFITRGSTAFFMSISGSLLSTIFLILLLKIKIKRLSFTGIGVICAVAHNMGQLLCSCVITGTFSMLYYFVPLMIFAAITGFVTGTIVNYTLPSIQKATKNLNK